ncbi:PilN domain-containing protein [Paraburkholderia rhizosphaerae]|uniref:Fimbrial assembly protein PilN n=1 Tax=Paraburkholderia rhizosphaerae TaxID=480658 RepID=A0A4R8L3M3_9BURK|nr:PilN domain-containing protein [Paraburkholderia rhizosphaerae]TDY37166.1 fimbrial assembly protein PilN [Paraburkholderia rhizosphaerae]
MTRLRWDFSGRHRWATRSSLACVVALAGCLHALWWRDGLLHKREALLARPRQTQTVAGGRGHRIAAAPSPVLTQVFEEMRYPWNDVLDSLQRATKPGVDLLELGPDGVAAQRMRIQGAATDAQRVFDLLAALQNDSLWSSVQLVSQTRNDGTDAPGGSGAAPSPPLPPGLSGSVRFSLAAQWKRP